MIEGRGWLIDELLFNCMMRVVSESYGDLDEVSLC